MRPGGPKLRDALDICEHPLALKKPTRNEFDGDWDEERMGSVTAQADQHRRRGTDDTALGRLYAQPPRCSRPMKPHCCCAVSVWRRHIVWRRGELLV